VARCFNQNILNDCPDAQHGLLCSERRLYSNPHISEWNAPNATGITTVRVCLSTKVFVPVSKTTETAGRQTVLHDDGGTVVIEGFRAAESGHPLQDDPRLTPASQIFFGNLKVYSGSPPADGSTL
jgi:hypothetical protein